jgi:acetoin utilization deacetylase AcuC-like enzyme
VQAFYSDNFVLPLPVGHRFPMVKYSLLRERVASEIAGVRLHQAPAATDGELALVHAPDYVRAVAEGLLPADAQREIGFPWSAAMVERSRRSAGATVAAARAALGGAGRGAGEGIAANLAGGTHHASADRGGGFCVFNDSAVAARLMQAEHTRGARGNMPLKVAIIDLDVHQGNGTASIFAADSSVFTLSLHGAKNFPFRKEAGDLDVELADGCTDEPYLEALQHALAELDRRFRPGLVIYIAGADPFAGDRLGRLSLSFGGLQARDRQVFDWAWQRRIPLAFSMAGGYGVDINDTVQVQINTWHVAMEYWRRWNV